MSKLLLGSISYCPPEPEKQELRIKAHTAQLRWLEEMKLEEYCDYEYIRVEQAYTPEFKEAVSTSLPVVAVEYDKGIGPSAARNVLLKRLYNSDSDWLVCMDDDRLLYEHYAGTNFIKECAINKHIVKLAKQGTMITCLSPFIRPFREKNAQFGKIDTHWNIWRQSLDGCLQICLLPNLVKYGYEPIYFNESNFSGMNEVPEDREFQFEWVLQKHPIGINGMMIMREVVPQLADSSTIYTNQEERLAVQATHAKAMGDYLKKRTNNRITSLRELCRRKNGFKPVAVPRLIPYTATDSDWGKYRNLSK